MNQTFGERLHSFSKTIDIVKGETLEDIKTLIKDYTYKTLEILHVRIMLDTIIENETWLYKHALGSEMQFKDVQAKPIRDLHGNYRGQMSCCYDVDKPMWIVSTDKSKFLYETDDYLDLWSNVPDIPNYVSIFNDDIKTSIIIPIYDEDGKCGVVNFETLEYLDITTEAKNELDIIARTLSNLFSLSKYTNSTKENTTQAIKSLYDSLHNHNYQKLTKPKIFLASSTYAESDVIESIIKTVCKYEDKLKLVYWKDNHNPGNINQQVLDDIASCRYGICYLSEKNKSGAKPEYLDNSNVVFEAGILHGKNDSGSSVISSWIPVRENESPKLPFDFAAERMLHVPRLVNGELNTKLFEETLEKGLISMLSSEF